jgi:hypothetical protein
MGTLRAPAPEYLRTLLGDGRMVKIAHLADEGQAIEQEIGSNPMKQSAVKVRAK